jgi:hypothetical protein
MICRYRWGLSGWAKHTRTSAVPAAVITYRFGPAGGEVRVTCPSASGGSSVNASSAAGVRSYP